MSLKQKCWKKCGRLQRGGLTGDGRKPVAYARKTLVAIPGVPQASLPELVLEESLRYSAS